MGSVDRRVAKFRRLIAEKVLESWRTTPHFAVSKSMPADGVLAEVARARAEVSPTVTVTDVLALTLADAFRAVRGLDRVDLGLAVATPYGVLIPVLRDVGGADLAALVADRRGAIDRARAGRLTPDDFADPPVSTLSNLGGFGVDSFTGIIPVGQTTLLTVGAIGPRVTVDASGELVVRQMFEATLNIDHRVHDGADGAQLLSAFADRLGEVVALQAGGAS